MLSQAKPKTNSPQGELGPAMAVESFEHAPVATEMVDLEGRLLNVNAAMVELTGYSREELIGSPTARLTHPDHAHRDQELRASLLNGDGDRYATEKRIVHAAGHSLEVAAHVSVVRAADGSPRYFVGQMLDGASKPVGGDTEATVELRTEHVPELPKDASGP
jgi:PAS domain S-box-containing protein